MMAVVIAFATIELGVVLVKDLVTPPVLILQIHELLELFGLFLLLLVGLELLETLKAYANDAVSRLEIIIVAAFIAVGRKVVTLDIGSASPAGAVSLAALVLALAGAYFMLRRSHHARAIDDEAADAKA
jgi:uncharacterized membrane protein (DUF373 family)